MNKSKTDLTMELVRSMNELRNHIRQFIQLKIKDDNINITFEMLEVMFYLWRKDAVNQQEISDITFRDKSSMTYLLDNLVKRNLVKRTEDDKDRRNKLIVLTDEGRALQCRLSPWLTELYQLASGELQNKALQDGIMLMNAMTNNIKEHPNEP